MPAGPRGWSSAACVSCSFITPTGITTAISASRSTQVCGEVDQPTAALIRDLKRRGLLDDTLVIWGGEFGRTPMGEVRVAESRPQSSHRRLHDVVGGRRAAAWLQVGETDEFGFSTVREPSDVHDIHATLLHLLGLEHTKLTFTFQGRPFRLTDVSGRVLDKILA